MARGPDTGKGRRRLLSPPDFRTGVRLAGPLLLTPWGLDRDHASSFPGPQACGLADHALEVVQSWEAHSREHRFTNLSHGQCSVQ